MQKDKFEIAQIIEQFGKEYVTRYKPNSYITRTLDALRKCRTPALGGHAEQCDSCGKVRYSYHSCKNRHCPKCQSSYQAFWVEDLLEKTLDVKHFHVVFTIPDVLHKVCMEDSAWFYNAMFSCVWETLRSFGYTHYGAETGAVCMLHTWAQNLLFHPHIHCIVPAAGFHLKGKYIHIGKNGKFLYPVQMLSRTFKDRLLKKIKRRLDKTGSYRKFKALVDAAWKKDWNVHCEPSFGRPEHVIRYLGQYTHRVAVSNCRIINIDADSVTFRFKDNTNDGQVKPTTISGVEFLRRFAMHILPYRFVKIRYFGIYSSRFRKEHSNPEKMKIKPPEKSKETVQQRLLRLTGFDVYKCPFCKKGKMVVIDVIPRVRSPSNPLYPSSPKH